MSAPKIRYHLNMRAALILVAVGLTAALGLYVLWGYQEKRILQIALKQVKAYQEAADKAEKTNDQDQKSRNNDLALRHLTQYLDARPNDPEGLDIKAELLFETKDLVGAALVYEHLIRAEGAPEPRAAGREVPPGREREPVSSRVQTARRRLAEIYIAISDFRRNSLLARLETVKVNNSLRYNAAELHAKNLLELDEKAPAQPFSEDAKAHLLYAVALEGQIVPGQTSRERVAFVAVRGEKGNEGWEVSVADGAILEYENALELNALKLMDKKALECMDEKARNEQMRDFRVGAIRLAGLYQKASRKAPDVTEQLKKLIIDTYKPIETQPEANRPDDAGPKSKNSPVENETFVGFLRAHSAARRLADIYQGSRKNIDIAKEVLDRLLEVLDSVEVRTARFAFFNSIGDRRNATAELEQAILLDPEDLVLILMAAENAMRLGSVGTFEPHFWLDQVPRLSRDDPRVLTVQGMVEYTAQKSEAALATWRKGLVASPSDVGLSQRLALVLLELGRDEEAAKIIAQYRRLVVSKSDPVLQFLEGIRRRARGAFQPRDREPGVGARPVARKLSDPRPPDPGALPGKTGGLHGSCEDLPRGVGV